MCSDPDKNLILDTIKEYKLDRIVVSSCSPRMHELTFRICVNKGKINPYYFEMANIREQCSWVHQKDKEAATKKAMKLTEIAVAKCFAMSHFFLFIHL